MPGVSEAALATYAVTPPPSRRHNDTARQPAGGNEAKRPIGEPPHLASSRRTTPPASPGPVPQAATAARSAVSGASSNGTAEVAGVGVTHRSVQDRTSPAPPPSPPANHSAPNGAHQPAARTPSYLPRASRDESVVPPSTARPDEVSDPSARSTPLRRGVGVRRDPPVIGGGETAQVVHAGGAAGTGDESTVEPARSATPHERTVARVVRTGRMRGHSHDRGNVDGANEEEGDDGVEADESEDTDEEDAGTARAGEYAERAAAINAMLEAHMAARRQRASHAAGAHNRRAHRHTSSDRSSNDGDGTTTSGTPREPVVAAGDAVPADAANPPTTRCGAYLPASQGCLRPAAGDERMPPAACPPALPRSAPGSPAVATSVSACSARVVIVGVSPLRGGSSGPCVAHPHLPVDSSEHRQAAPGDSHCEGSRSGGEAEGYSVSRTPPSPVASPATPYVPPPPPAASSLPSPSFVATTALLSDQPCQRQPASNTQLGPDSVSRVPAPATRHEQHPPPLALGLQAPSPSVGLSPSPASPVPAAAPLVVSARTRTARHVALSGGIGLVRPTARHASSTKESHSVGRPPQPHQQRQQQTQPEDGGGERILRAIRLTAAGVAAAAAAPASSPTLAPAATSCPSGRHNPTNMPASPLLAPPAPTVLPPPPPLSSLSPSPLPLRSPRPSTAMLVRPSWNEAAVVTDAWGPATAHAPRAPSPSAFPSEHRGPSMHGAARTSRPPTAPAVVGSGGYFGGSGAAHLPLTAWRSGEADASYASAATSPASARPHTTRICWDAPTALPPTASTLVALAIPSVVDRPLEPASRQQGESCLSPARGRPRTFTVPKPDGPAPTTVEGQCYCRAGDAAAGGRGITETRTGEASDPKGRSDVPFIPCSISALPSSAGALVTSGTGPPQAVHAVPTATPATAPGVGRPPLPPASSALHTASTTTYNIRGSLQLAAAATSGRALAPAGTASAAPPHAILPSPSSSLASVSTASSLGQPPSSSNHELFGDHHSSRDTPRRLGDPAITQEEARAPHQPAGASEQPHCPSFTQLPHDGDASARTQSRSAAEGSSSHGAPLHAPGPPGWPLRRALAVAVGGQLCGTSSVSSLESAAAASTPSASLPVSVVQLKLPPELLSQRSTPTAESGTALRLLQVPRAGNSIKLPRPPRPISAPLFGRTHKSHHPSSVADRASLKGVDRTLPESSAMSMASNEQCVGSPAAPVHK